MRNTPKKVDVQFFLDPMIADGAVVQMKYVKSRSATSIVQVTVWPKDNENFHHPEEAPRFYDAVVNASLWFNRWKGMQ